MSLRHFRLATLGLLLGASSLGLYAPGAQAFDIFHAASALYKGAKAYTVTNEDIIEISRESVRSLDRSNKVAPSSGTYAKRLARLTSAFRKVGSIPLNFKVYITSDVNAFACPDGSVRVFSALMDMMTDDELLGVIGHEIGHVGMEHSFKAYRKQMVNSALIDAAGTFSATVRNISDGALGQLGAYMMSAKFSRKQETEADDYGYDFLKRCGKNPYALVKAFEKMEKMSAGKSSKSTVSRYINRMFSDHPEMSKRITHLKDRCRRDGYRP